MRFGARHLACVLLLVASLGGAQASSPSNGAAAARCVQMWLHGEQVLHGDPAPLPAIQPARSGAALPANGRAAVRAVWTVRPPTAHSMNLQAVTASSR